jgi:hypothetical protein
MVYNIIMRNNQIDNVFTSDEIKEIQEAIDKELATREIVEWDDAVDSNWHEKKIIRIKRNNLGRLDINELQLPSHIVNKVVSLAKENCQLDLKIERLISVTYAEYNLKYGQPILEVHKDRDPIRNGEITHTGGAGVVLTYQLDSNISWQVGSNKDLYTIPDNGILMLYPRQDYHWRTIRKWNEGDFVKVLFFEMFTPNSPKVIDDKKLEQEIRDFRRDIGEKI